MAFRGGLGPVYAFEWLTATRRWQMYALRSAFVGLLLLGLVFVWINERHPGNLSTINVQARIGRQFYNALTFIAMVIVLLAAPAATAGAICLDKARGTLFHVLVTDLSDAEIVLGKLAARLVPVLALVASSLPVMALGTLLGGIDPVALTGSFLVIVGFAVLGCALALALSVWGKKTHEVLLATYMVWIVWFLVLPTWLLVNDFLGNRPLAPDWVAQSNPFVLTVLAHNPSDPTSPGLAAQGLFLAGAIAISAALVALSVARLRPAIIHQWGRAERVRSNGRVESAGAWRRFLANRLGPTLDGNPVLWREWHRRRPSRWARIVWGLYIALAVMFSVMSVTINRGPGDLASVVNGFVASIGLLLLSVTSATSLSEERARGSLDVLLTTPLSTASVVWGKWWGAFRMVPLLAILPGLVALALGIKSGRWIASPLIVLLVLAYGAAITSLGLALATWIRQTGRVLALCVTAVVAMTVGTIPVVVILFEHAPRDMAPCVAMVSPFFGVGFFSAVIEKRTGGQHWPEIVGWALFWIAEYATAAGVLLIATLLTFDRCLGRISDRSALPSIQRTSKPKKRRKPIPAIAEDF